VIRIPKFPLDLPVRVLGLLLRFGRMHPGRSNIRPDLRCFLLPLLPGGLFFAHEAPKCVLQVIGAPILYTCHKYFLQLSGSSEDLQIPGQAL
jgi:hypothetical protein